MKYFLEDITQRNIEQLTAQKIIRWKKGQIPTGNMIEQENPDGTKEMVEETRPGLLVEFEKEPTAEQQQKLDRHLIGLRRDGGKTLTDEVDEIKAKIDKLEAKK